MTFAEEVKKKRARKLRLIQCREPTPSRFACQRKPAAPERPAPAAETLSGV
jgi:hypothetical protein